MCSYGEVLEWLNRPVSKTGVRVTVPRVQIPPSPPVFGLSYYHFSEYFKLFFSPCRSPHAHQLLKPSLPAILSPESLKKVTGAFSRRLGCDASSFRANHIGPGHLSDFETHSCLSAPPWHTARDLSMTRSDLHRAVGGKHRGSSPRRKTNSLWKCERTWTYGAPVSDIISHVFRAFIK